MGLINNSNFINILKKLRIRGAAKKFRSLIRKVRSWGNVSECREAESVRVLPEDWTVNNFIKRLDSRDIIVTFTGGLGAQIFSCAIFEYLIKKKAPNVYADLSYFNIAPRIALKGGGVSIWEWELEKYRILKNHFALRPNKTNKLFKKKPYILCDGLEKIRLGIEALQDNSIKALFPIDSRLINRCQEINTNFDYICVHLRRGDYLNVASHLIKDEDFLKIVMRFQGISRTIVVVSDSDISDNFKMAIQGLFDRKFFFEKSDIHLTHAVIRKAKHVICSNSTFSLTAALLNTSGGFVMIPCIWFGAIHSHLQPPMDALCGFQVIRQK